MLTATAPGGVLYRTPAPWLGHGAPWVGIVVLLVLGWLGLIRALLGIGPVGVAPDRAWWVWRLPAAQAREPWRALGRLGLLTTVATGLLGVIAGLVAYAAGSLPPVGVGVAGVAGIVAGAGAVLVAARVQASRARVRRVAGLPGWELRRAGAAIRHLGNAVGLASGSEIRQILAGAEETGIARSGARIPGWVTGPHRVLLYATLTAQARTRWIRRAVLDVVVVVVVLAAFSPAVVPAAWAGLVFIAYRGVGRATAYLTDLRMGTAAEGLLPVSGTATAVVRLVVPCVSNAVALGATAAAVGLAAQAPVLPLLAIGAIAGAGVGAAVAYRLLGPAPDLTEPPIETPFGLLPRAQLASYGRGLFLMLLLVTAPSVVVGLPHLWPAVLIALIVVTAVAIGLAITTGTRV